MQAALDFLVDLIENEGSDVSDVPPSDSGVQQNGLHTPSIGGRQSSKSQPVYREMSNPDDFLKPTEEQEPKNTLKEIQYNSLIHKGDTDSSDDEDNKYYHEQTYDAYGKKIKQLLAQKVDSKCNSFALNGTARNDPSKASWKSMPTLPSAQNSSFQPSKPMKSNKKLDTEDLYTDPISGIRIVNPLITSAFLREKMIGRQSVAISNMKKYIEQGQLSDDWVTVGVIVGSSQVKFSQKGSKYMIWTLSDLKGDLKTVSLFLFSNAHSAFWKTAKGVVVGILNPSIMDKRDGSKDEATLSVDVAQKILVIGKSKDLGCCKSRKKDGGNCTAFVNTHSCEHCIYHAQQEYRKCSRRSELQSSGSSALNGLRNKVLGKSEIFYGGKSFIAIPAKASKKQSLNDNMRMQQMSGTMPSNSVSPQASGVQSVAAGRMFQQRLASSKQSDQQLCSRLGVPAPTSQPRLQQTKLTAVKAVPGKAETTTINSSGDKRKESSMASSFQTCLNAPRSTLSLKKFDNVEFNVQLRNTPTQQAKIDAIRLVREKGLVVKNPNAVKKRIAADWIQAMKRKVEADTGDTGVRSKQMKTEGDAGGEQFKSRFKQLMAATSKHTDLVEAADQEAQDKYFDNLELKEKLEEKMLSTYKLDCKAVKCLTCNYKAFSSSDLCKKEGHTIRVVDAVKRFFRCRDCSNRTITLELIPLTSCKQCGGSRWERAPMLREKKTNMHTLSICGNNDKPGGCSSDANLNLLVPE